MITTPNDERQLGMLWLAEPESATLHQLAASLHDDRISSPNAQQRLAKAATKSLSASAATAAAIGAWSMARQRRRAIEKLGEEIGSVILFDTDGLEMASHQLASAYHVDITNQAGVQRLVDWTAGIGADTLAFAAAGLRVLACDIDPVRITYLRETARRLGLDELIEVHLGSAAELDAERIAGWHAFIDPPRRNESSRWTPSAEAQDLLDACLRSNAPGVLAKLAPAVDRVVAMEWQGDLEFLSAEGECKEALLRTGDFWADSGEPEIAAVLLPSRARISAGDNSAVEIAAPDQAAYFYEADPAVIRAAAVDALAREHGLSRIDHEIAYLVGDHLVTTPFATSYRVLAAMPYHRKPVQAWLDESGAGALIVKKRGVPDDPEAVRRQFRLSSDAKNVVILVLTRQGRRAWALFVERLPAA